MENNIVINAEDTGLYKGDEKAAIDIQISTAKAYPRNIQRALKNSIDVATIDKEVAETCFYSLPRAGKKINGPSVHLARIIAQNWCNLRVESKIVNITDKQIISQSVCFDLETNYAVKVEVRRSIVGSNGQRYKDDMITVTGNAANAIAYRNAVFSVIPKNITDKVYTEAQNKITGDLTDETKLIERRNKAVKFFIETYNVSENQILTVLGLNNVNQLKKDEIINLLGIQQAIKDGDTTIKEVFAKSKSVSEKKTDLKKSNNSKPEMP